MVQFCDELKIASHYIINTESIVKYSFVVLKSVAYLDLSLCELSSLRGKRKPNYMIGPFSIIVTSNFVCTEEGCRKNLAQNRKLLYDFHLDVSCELELPLGNNRTDEKLRYYSDSVLLNKMSIVSVWFEMCLNRMVTHALQETNQQVKLLHQISKIARRIRFVGKHGYIRTEGSNILFSKCRDSNIVKDYLIAMDFGDEYLLKLRPQVVGYLLYHASCAGYRLGDDPPREDLINSAICRRNFEHAELLFQYRDAPRFCVSAYAEMKNNLRVER
ncbi:hypothetical protein AVEN_128233-1 [Araneus ventricosus]|uniref:Uncharacterized protein n=1 Tax=Araneus ventricosus TaxID=182803 RepID=A0A4Y2A023_ARAVE|nr:hypothetical protein AVEN_128233-1 [Araneus ventricosus]